MKGSAAPAALEGRPASDPSSLSRRDKTLALAGTLAALLMAGLDQTIVATAGPEIQRDLRIAAALYPWITTAYLVASTVMLPIYGKLSDVFGRKPILVTGVALFLLGSFLCGVAPSTGFLIAARAVQGLGAASLFTSTLAVIADLFPPAERGKYMGLIAAVMGISSVVGPLAGGVITELLGWHWVFFVNLPVGAVALWLIVTRMPDLGRQAESVPVAIDFAGALWLVAFVVPLLLALSLGRPSADGADGFAWTSWQIAAMLAAAAAAFALFLRAERRAADPILDFSLFSHNRTVGFATLTMFVLGSTFLFTVVFLPLYLVNVLGISVASAGLSLTPMTLGMVATSVLSGQLASRRGGVKRILVVALALLAGAFAIMAFTLSPGSSQSGVTMRMVLIGLGMGPTLPLYTLLVQNASRPQDIGAVTGGSIFARAMGQVIGLALFGTLFATVLATSAGRHARAVIADLPPAAAAAVATALPAGTPVGEGVDLTFDEVALRSRIADALGGSAAPPEAAETARATAAGIGAGFRTALTDAVRALYLIGVVLVLISLALTLLIPADRAPGAGAAGPKLG